MKKLIEYFIIKYIDFKIWIHKKKRGSTWDKFQYGIFWMVILILTSILLGKII